MIIQHTADKAYVLFTPEDMKERKALDSFPGLLRQKLQFYCPNKQNIVYNLYVRLKRKIKNIKYTASIKEMVEGDLKILQLPEDFHFHTSPLPHQLIALRFAYTFGSFLNLSEPGLGKTKVTLDYIWLKQFKKSLIVCPKALCFVWEEETRKHRPELSVYVIRSTDWEKERVNAENANIVVINYDKAVALEEALKGLQSDFIAVDEGLIKNPSTERTKALTRLSKTIGSRCVMSGTLVNNSPLDVFAPLRFIEPALVGESFSKFRDEYALVSRTNRYITVGYKNVPEVKDMLASCGVILTKAEWLKTLPKKKFIHKYVQMGDVQRDYYNKLASNYLLQIPEVDAEIEVDNPLSVLIKLNQISNGFIYYKDNNEETLDDLYGRESAKRRKVDRKTFIFQEQPKAEALIRLIKSDEFNSDACSSLRNTEHLGDLAAESRTESGGNCSRLFSARTRKEYSNTSEFRSTGTLDINTSISGSGHDVIGATVTPGSQILSSRDDAVRRTFDGNELKSLPNASTTNRRAIIWFNLAAELTILEQYFGDAGITFLTIRGGTKDIGDKVREFNSNPSIQFLLCQAKTINYGVTIMGTAEEDLAEDIFPEFDPLVSDEIFYSLNFSLEVFLQQQDRIHRIGQTRECRYWILLTNSKIERRIADRLEEKQICNKEILVDIISNLGADMLEE